MSYIINGTKKNVGTKSFFDSFSPRWDEVIRFGTLILSSDSNDGCKRLDIYLYKNTLYSLIFEKETERNLSYSTVAEKKKEFPYWKVWKRLDEYLKDTIISSKLVWYEDESLKGKWSSYKSMTQTEFYKKKGITFYTRIPEGWKVKEGTTTEPIGYRWIWNCKSLFKGEYQHGLISERNIAMSMLIEGYLNDDVSIVEWLDSVIENKNDELHKYANQLSDEDLTELLTWAGSDDWYYRNHQSFSKNQL